MEYISKIEREILKWTKDIPHLPLVARKWLGDNIWWIATIGVILIGISVIVTLSALLGGLALIGTVAATYYVASSVTALAVVLALINLTFTVVQGILLALAIKPLKEKQKNGWTLLFVIWLLGAVATLVGAILSLNPLTFITGILFGAIWLAISGYFIFEIHGQFVTVERSHGVKNAKISKTAKKSSSK